MVDINEIRAALAAATPQPDGSEWGKGYAVMYGNAPVWLAQLADEVERLRAERRTSDNLNMRHIEKLVVQRDEAQTERDAWRACADRLLYRILANGLTADAVYERLKAESE